MREPASNQAVERLPDELFFPESEGSRDFWGDRMTLVELCDRESVKWPVNVDDDGWVA